MIDMNKNIIKCDNCNYTTSLDDNLKKWCTRQHINRLSKDNKHYCPHCTKQYEFYPNGVVIF